MSETILITGGNSGIGLATAKLFASHGINVAICGRRRDANDAAERELLLVSDRVIALQCDVTSEAQVKSVIQDVVSHFGGLTYAFNNAGYPQLPATYDRASGTDYEAIFNTNVRGTWLCMRYEIEQMLKAGAGAIVNAGSASGSVAFAQIPLYVAAKHAVHGLTKSYALEFAERNIRINAVAPGAIQTDMLTSMFDGNPAFAQACAVAHPMKRIGTPEEVARAVYWLCKDATWTTGAIVAIDGGYTAQ